MLARSAFSFITLGFYIVVKGAEVSFKFFEGMNVDVNRRWRKIEIFRGKW